MQRLIFAAAAFGVLMVSASDRVLAQAYPSRPITLVAALSAGNPVDISARVLAGAASKHLGQTVTVEPRPGAGGMVAAQYIQTSPPDGYRIMMTISPVHEILPSLQKLPFDPIKDLTLIGRLYTTDAYIVARSNLPANSVGEVIALAKSTPKGLSFGDTGVGSLGHLTAGILGQLTGAPIEIVHYNGPELYSDLSEGRVDVGPGSSLTSIRPGLDQQKIKILAVNSTTRSARFPNVPTLVEAGFGDAVAMGWFGLIGPPNMPPAIVERLYSDFEKAMRDPEVVQKFEELDFRPVLLGGKAFVDATTATQQRFGKAIKDMGLKVE